MKSSLCFWLWKTTVYLTRKFHQTQLCVGYLNSQLLNSTRFYRQVGLLSDVKVKKTPPLNRSRSFKSEELLK